MAKIGLRAYNREIDLLIEHGQIDEAIAHCKYILRFYPKHIETYRLLGKAYIESQRYSEAADILQRILSVLPDDFVSQIGMSIIREDEGNLDAAIFHMERAHEIQASNVAIQDELRRLYGRRDGVEPPKLRLTRGALVRLYAKGDLYRQAIAEIRAALAEDPNRFDLEVILARMYYLQGQKVEATDIASRLVTRLPYCLEANRVLADVLPTTARAEDAKIYQQRIFALDPYLAYLSPNAPTSSLVPDNAVTLDRLAWQGAATVEEQPAWARNVGVSLTTEEEAETTPEWLATAQEETTEEMAGPVTEAENIPTEAGPTEIPSVGESQIPDWMREAGWEVSGKPGAESPAAELAEGGEGIAPGEIPDWLKGMAPAPAAAEGVEEESKLDWLDQILPPAETAEAAPAEAGLLEGEPAEEIAPETGLQIPGIPAQAEAEEPLPDWLTFPELETPAAEALPQEKAPEFVEEAAEAVPAQEAGPEFAETVTPEEAVSAVPEEMAEAVTPEEVVSAVPEEVAEAVTPEEVVSAVPEEVAVPVIPAEVVSVVPEEMPEAGLIVPEEGAEVATEEAAPPVPEEFVAEAIQLEAELPISGVTEAVSEEAVAAFPEEAPEAGLPEEIAPVPPEEVVEALQPAETAPLVAEEAVEAVVSEEMVSPISEEAAEAIPTQGEIAAAVPEEAIETAPLQEVAPVIPTEAVEAIMAEEAAPIVPEEIPETAPAVEMEPAVTEAPVEEVLPQEVVQTFPEEEIEFIPTAEEKPAEAVLPVEEAAAVEVLAEAVVEEADVEALPAPFEAPEAAAEVETPSEEKTQPIRITPLAAEEPAPPAAAVAEPVSEAGPSDIDAAMAWLEGLAARQGADEGTLSTTAEERLETPPEWVTAELKKAQLAGEELPVPAEAVQETAPIQELEEAAPAPVEEAAAEIQAPAAEEAAEVIPLAVEEAAFPTEEQAPVAEAAAPVEAPQAAISPEQMNEDAAFAWLESLAARQGAVEGTLVTPEEERPTEAPSWVVEQAATEPGLTDASELLEGSLAGAEVEVPEQEIPAAEAVEIPAEEVKPVSPVESEEVELSEIQETLAQAPEAGEWIAELPLAPEAEEIPAVELPPAEAGVPPAEAEEPLPSWLQEFEPAAGEEVKEIAPASEEDLPDWLKGFETPAEAPITQASDESISVSTWLKEEAPPQPALEEPGWPAPETQATPESVTPEPAASILSEGMPVSENPLLAQAQTDLRNGNTASAVNIFGQLIENGQNLDEIIPILQESLYRYPVDISLWQTLGDAFIRNNRIQEALDAYTKAEELLK